MTQPSNEEPQEVPIVHDKRRIDPQTGQVRQPESAAAQGEPQITVPDDLSSLDTPSNDASATLAAERLADLQRLQAEYVNYRKRVERDRDVAKDKAIESVMEALLPTLDDLALARQHGDLDGTPFAAIADKLEAVLNRFGLARYGEIGATFDPAVHDALMHNESDEATDTTVTMVMQPGYMMGEKVLRPARVGVTAPTS